MIGDNSNPDMSHEGTFRWVGLPALHSYWDIVAHWVTCFWFTTCSPGPGPPVVNLLLVLPSILAHFILSLISVDPYHVLRRVADQLPPFLAVLHNNPPTIPPPHYPTQGSPCTFRATPLFIRMTPLGPPPGSSPLGAPPWISFK